MTTLTPTSPTCQHELRPGLTVCLHCRSAARAAARDRIRRIAARIGLTVTAIAVIAAIAGANIDTFRGRLSAAAMNSSTTGGASTGGASTGSPSAKTTGKNKTPGGAQLAYAAAPRGARPTLVPVVAEGRTTLARAAFGAGVFVERHRDTLRVYFDTEDARTRRRDKFEAIVRSTLPELYGPAADSLLAKVPAGALVGSADLLGELPKRGLRLAAADGSGTAIALWPETRPGRDGPLVVSYRAVAVHR